MKLIYGTLVAAGLLLASVGLSSGQTNYVANTGNANTPGVGNTLVGAEAGNLNMEGYFNTFIGFRAGFVNTVGSSNTFIGAIAGCLNTTGYSNTFIGHAVGNSNTTGHDNTFMGVAAGYDNTTGSDNTFIGTVAGNHNTTGNANTFLGYQSGYSTTTGSANVFVGSLAGASNTTGAGNLFVGQQAGSNNSTGNYNLFMGNGSGNATTTGAGNTAIGDGSGLHNTTGQRNVSIGQYAGLNNQTGSDNVFIGYGAKAGTVNPTNLTNAVAIGANAVVSQSNAIVLGNGANVGIGTSTPAARLEIRTGIGGVSGLKFTNLTSASPTTVNVNKFLTLDASGNVILATYAYGGRESATDAFWQRNGQFLQPLTNEPVVIGSTISQTPAGYKLFVEEGILTERVKVAVKNTSEWSDKVFAKTYQLQPLADVENYIQQHQHLPGVPSAAEMVAKGNDLHQTDAKLLEKIEELTLYSIQLEKANRAQAEKLQAMEQEQQRQKQKQAELERLLQGVLKRK